MPIDDDNKPEAFEAEVLDPRVAMGQKLANFSVTMPLLIVLLSAFGQPGKDGSMLMWILYAAACSFFAVLGLVTGRMAYKRTENRQRDISPILAILGSWINGILIAVIIVLSLTAIIRG